VILQVFCAGLLLPAGLCCVYYLFLATVGLLFRQKPRTLLTNASHTFAIIIPAHNEETTILATLRACADLDYPVNQFKVYVIADNCTDATARIAARAGALVLERRDEQQRGKGPALSWALERILPDQPDAVVVLDADCRLDRHALRVFDERLAAGDAVLQASYVAGNPEDSAISYAVAVGNRLENDLFYSPKSRLGLAVLLRGTGMVFRRDVLQRHPWRAHSVTEDTEYSVELLRAGVPVRFLPDVQVVSDFPVCAEQMQVQRRRWAAGTCHVGKARALALMMEGITAAHGVLVDLGWTLLVLSKPLVLGETLAAVLLAGLCTWLTPGPLSSGLLATGLAVMSLLGLYVALGVVQLGLNGRRMLLLARSATVFVSLLGITLQGLFGRGRLAWARTPRGLGEY
jgi:1,2-diacylglycerol 3-beta-glucosyltransferase